MNIDELRALLSAHTVPFETWGTGETKTIGHLLSELEVGEATLQEKDGRLIWTTAAAGVNVYHYHLQTDVLYRLVEDRQVFTGGRIRKRGSLCKASIMEKMRPGETTEIAACRAVEEELGVIKSDGVVFSKPHTKKICVGPIEARSYPGILSTYDMTIYRWYMPRAFFKAEGYVESQSDKSTYFEWQVVPPGTAIE